MISVQHQCIFVHVPKTAGQSIEHAFLNLCGLTWEQRSQLLMRYNTDPSKGPERLAHLTAAEYLAYSHVDAHTFESYFKFAFVRNPWDRLASEYRYRRYNYQVDFKRFVMHGLPKPSNYSDYYRHILPQYNFLYNTEGQCLVDFIGRFERLQADFSSVCKKLSLPDIQLPHVNKLGNKSVKRSIKERFLVAVKRPGRHLRSHYTEYYDQDTIDAVAKFYEKDIEAFGYTFDPQ